MLIVTSGIFVGGLRSSVLGFLGGGGLSSSSTISAGIAVKLISNVQALIPLYDQHSLQHDL